MTTTPRPASEIWPDLHVLGRHAVDETEYVVYDDGAYRCAIEANDWDDVPERFAAPDEDGTLYSEWCGSTMTVDDPDVLAELARLCGVANLFDGAGFVPAGGTR